MSNKKILPRNNNNRKKYIEKNIFLYTISGDYKRNFVLKTYLKIYFQILGRIGF